MNEEIKESINCIQRIVDFYKLNDENNYDYSDDVLISMKTLLDYITNLQQKYENSQITLAGEWKKRLEVEEERNTLYDTLRLARTKYNNDKAKYRRKAKKYKYIINELEKYIKENSIYYNTSDGCQWVDQFKVLDKLKELKGES